MTVKEEIALADRRRFVLNAAQWAQFIELIDRPTTEKPALRRLLTELSALEKQ